MSYTFRVLSISGEVLIETNCLSIAKEIAIAEHGTFYVRMFNGVYKEIGRF